MGSTNDQPPFLGPELPTYPELPQMCRVAAPAVVDAGLAKYPSFVQQWDGAAFRDREACYVMEANNIPLGPGQYDCRLVGSFAGLPLLATHCCLTGGAFSSASPSLVG